MTNKNTNNENFETKASREKVNDNNLDNLSGGWVGQKSPLTKGQEKALGLKLHKKVFGDNYYTDCDGKKISFKEIYKMKQAIQRTKEELKKQLRERAIQEMPGIEPFIDFFL